MCGGDHGFKRMIVWIAALIVMIFACIDLSDCHGRGYCFFVNVGILVLSLFGVMGAWRNDAKLLGWFLLLSQYTMRVQCCAITPPHCSCS